MEKVIIVEGRNETDELEQAVEERLAALTPGWSIVSVATTLVPWGEWKDRTDMKYALHVYMAVTIVVRWP